MSNNDILQLIIYTVSGFVVGLLIHKLVMPFFGKLASKTTFKSDDLIIKTIRKWVIPWFLALGIFLGLKRLDLDSRFSYWLENGLLIFYIASTTLIIARIISGLMHIRASGTDTILPSSSIIGNIVRVIIYCIGLLIILQSQGISITPMLTALGVGGLAVALALQNTLSNLFAGLQIIASGKINHGDYVKLSTGEDGFVEDISWRSTSLRAASDHIIIVPNSKLADMIVNNYYLPFQEVTFNVEIGVDYKSNLQHVEMITKEVIQETLAAMEEGVKGTEPTIRFYSFDESSIKLKAFLRVKDYSSQFAVKSEFIKRLHERYNKEGINLPFPTRTVIMQKDKEGL
ncbi:MAG TPA: mechanosensitive ion channel family protein [Ferruginibacter sp.]|nr:mechanosensitive ion channel family protein [Ferruginibacter sp.]